MKSFRKNKGQNVAEYAILIALVVGAVIAMQKFAQRGLQARTRDAVHYMVGTTKFPTPSGSKSTANYDTAQYEPYYQDSNFETTRMEDERKYGTGNVEGLTSNTDTDRAGYQRVGINGVNIGTGLKF